MALGEAFRDASREGLAARSLAAYESGQTAQPSIAHRTRAWVRAVRARWREMTLTSIYFSLRFAVYKVVYDLLVLA